MRIACPHCQATYRLSDISPGTILVCHRCNTEFVVTTPELETGAPPAKSDDQLHLFGRTGSNSSVSARSPDADMQQPLEESAAPVRRNVKIWPWLVSTLLLVTLSGFLVQKDAWLDNPWLRSTLINLGLPVEVRNKDWLVRPETVQAQWLKRTDGSRVLVIEGRLVNQLSCELPLPQLVLDFYADDAPDKIVKTELVTVTLPPSMQTIRHAPYRAPAVDDVPVAARGERGFLVVLDSVPPRIADFTIGIQATQP